MAADTAPPTPPSSLAGQAIGGPRAWYALVLMTLVSAMSLLDRQIVTILAPDIKRDLSLTDSELGLLYGTVFALFYALFGIPLGRLADTWIRTRLMAVGLAGWSLMTMYCGIAGNFFQFALGRAGVGVGEASASPAAFSLLSDYFPKEKRATVVGLYACGVPIGIGISLALGGSVADGWNAAFPTGDAPLGLRGWQAAFIVVGAPGMLLAALVALLKEPQRGIVDGITDRKPEPHPFRRSFADLAAIVPPFSLANLVAIGAPRLEWLRNLSVIAGVVAGAAVLTWTASSLVPADRLRVLFTVGTFKVTGHTVQWATIALAVYCIYSWAQSLRLRDLPTHRLIWGTPTVVLLILAAALNMLINYGVTGWSPYFLVTEFKMPLAEAGIKFGVVAGAAGLVGTAAGGFLGDFWWRRDPRGRLFLTLVSMILPAPIATMVFTSETPERFLFYFFLLGCVTTAWFPGVVSTCQDLVLPRMRGAVAAAFYLGSTLIGLGTGAYLVGLASDVSGNLRYSILGLYALAPLMWLCMVIAIRGVREAEKTRVARAREAGEDIDQA